MSRSGAGLARWVVGGLALTATLVGCADQHERYCDAVEEHQQELGSILSDRGPSSLLEALPAFQELAEQAPDDVRDDWSAVIDALEGLKTALADAGVDPATYDRDSPPPGVGEAEKAEIDAAARQLGSDRTARALAAVEQQAKDVCQTPLSI